MRLAFAIVLELALFSVVNASEPGQPLQADDWVAVLPGISIEAFEGPYLCEGQSGPEFLCTNLKAGDQDAASNRYVNGYRHPIEPSCVSDCLQRSPIKIYRPDGSSEIVAYIDDRQAGLSLDKAALGSEYVDWANGTMLVTYDVWCYFPGPPASACSYPPFDLHDPRMVVRISGLPTLFEILQTYQPVGGPISFRVPAAPEGLVGADHFNTYYGPLSGPKDFSQAQPLRCNYPATIPQPGDYLEAGLVPDPPSRQAYYYVTAATYQGETRYGRKRENGVLSGRDPAGLPPCVQPLPAARDGASVATLRKTP